MTSLDALRNLGWKAKSLPALGVTDPGKTIIRKRRCSVELVAGDDDLAARMALAAALVAEGHDLIGLLNAARDLLDVRDEAEQIVRARIDVVLDVVDGAT